MNRLGVMGLLAATLAVGGCIQVYRPEVRQGNVVTQAMVDKLKPGMTRSQVRFVLGTPLIADPFHPDRWDYHYYSRATGAPIDETRHLTVVFKDDALIAVHGDVIAKGPAPAADTDAAVAAPAAVPPGGN